MEVKREKWGMFRKGLPCAQSGKDGVEPEGFSRNLCLEQDPEIVHPRQARQFGECREDRKRRLFGTLTLQTPKSRQAFETTHFSPLTSGVSKVQLVVQPSLLDP